MSGGPPVIVWFRDDLRLADNPAFSAAAATGHPLLCVYVHDEESEGLRPLGGAAKWWLHGSLEALDKDLRKLGGELVIVRGKGDAVIEALAAETAASGVYWNRRYDEAGRAVDTRLKSVLKARGVDAESFNGALLHEPWAVKNKAGAPFKVFTAYWRAARDLGDPLPPSSAPTTATFLPLNESLRARGIALEDLGFEPAAPDWAAGMRAAWSVGEAAAQRRLEEFLEESLSGYAGDRDRPDLPATSRLSPYLRFGNISPRQIWHAAAGIAPSGRAAGLDKFLAELGWREFCYHLLYSYPDLATSNFQRRFDAMPWQDDPEGLHAWQRGRTGYPIVDAGMRELWATGWMHNRVRMIAASFLTKHLLIHWREGEAWFWDTLVDADPANNPAGWQWVAGSGADAAPYFRIFNPILQGEKFDPDGAYVRRWVPELSSCPNAAIHKPWMLKASDRRAATGYPAPIIDHDFARRRALDAFAETK